MRHSAVGGLLSSSAPDRRMRPSESYRNSRPSPSSKASRLQSRTKMGFLHATLRRRWTLSSSAPDRRMRPFQVLSKLKLESFIRTESFAINTKTGLLARDTPPSVDSLRISSSAPDRRMRPFRVQSKLKLHCFIQSESFAMNSESGFLPRDTPPLVDSLSLYLIECA